RIATWAEGERVLAGFPDGRAGEGPSGGAESLVGLRLADERGWSAPPAETEPDQPPQQATAKSAVGAAEQADTRRAETETKVEAEASDDPPNDSGGSGEDSRDSGSEN